VVILALCVQRSLPAQPAATVSIPFVGCKSDGQTGPMDAPKGKAKSVSVSPQDAQQLAYYEFAQGIGALAPRGWHCFGIYGSGGDALIVSPQAIESADFIGTNRRELAGPAIEVSHRFGGTSGRFDVAEVIARVFPAHKAFITSVRQGFDLDFPSGPYPRDKLVYKSDRVVEYETPPQADGLGTQSWIKKTDGPIDGVAMLIGETPDLVLLSVRLPSELSSLTPAIVGQLERDAPRFN
jgi:hypothetical protein